MKIKTSKKKFYNEFDYKITLFIEGSECLRYYPINESKKFLENGTIPKFYISDQRKLKIMQNKNLLINLCNLLINYDKNTWKKRIERSYIDIYSNNIDLVNDLKLNLYDHITTVFEPDKETLDPFTIKVKKIPDNKFKYRVFLLPHKLKGDLDAKKNYISWIESQNEKIKMSDAVKTWFMKSDWNWDPRYILVDEESTLLLLKLRNTELVGRIYKFIIH